MDDAKHTCREQSDDRAATWHTRGVKEGKMIAPERRQRILLAIEDAGVASIRDLAARFGVTPITITRDLKGLEQQGLVRRVHGGAIGVRASSYEPPFVARETHLSHEKRRIAQRAVE